MTPPDPLEALAQSVLDGTPVDWESADARMSAAARSAVRQMMLLERLAQFHRNDEPGGGVRTLARQTDPPSQRWGHLHIRGVLGRGAFGIVYRAWDPGLDREVALKLLTVPVSDGRESSALLEEGRLLARVRHSNVVTVHGAARIGNQVGVWMELVAGPTLEERLARGHRFGPVDTTRIGLELCGAVAAVHAAGLLHRDIKTQNVVQAEHGRIVLMDLGAGLEVAAGSRPTLAGTPLYLAPEVLEGGETTVQSDVYALGVLLYRLLTGSYPVTANTIPALREAHADGRRVDVRRAAPTVPVALARVVERAMDADRSRRYASVQELSAALASLQRGHPARAIAAVLVIVGIAGSAGWMLANSRPGATAGTRVAIRALETGSLDAGDQVLSNGLMREIQGTLRLLDGDLAFLPSTSAARDAVAAGRALDADFVVEGSAVRAGDGVHVKARFVRVDDGRIVWDIDRAIRDVFEIQDDISRAVAAEIGVPPRLPRRHPIGLDVVYDFLHAREVQSHRSPEHMAQAAALFEAVVKKAPRYPAAWAGIATSLADEARLHDVPYPPRMREAAQYAIQLDDAQAEAQAAMGSLFAAAGQWREADEAFVRATEIDPGLEFLYTEFVLSSLLPQGRLEEALDYLDVARRHAPLSLDVMRVKALVLVEARRYDEAIAAGRWVLDRDPGYPFANLWLGRALALSGRLEEALQHYGSTPGTEAYRGYALAALGRPEEAERLAAALEGEPHRQMLIYGGLGDRERALHALERVVAQNRWRAATWMIRPEVDILRDHPRYAVIRDRLKLPPERRSWWAMLRSRVPILK